MTNKTKSAIEEAANRMIRDGETLTTAARFYLKMGMQEVIEHPERYGLMKASEQADTAPEFKCYEIHTVQARMYGCDKQCRECEIEEKSASNER